MLARRCRIRRDVRQRARRPRHHPRVGQKQTHRTIALTSIGHRDRQLPADAVREQVAMPDSACLAGLAVGVALLESRRAAHGRRLRARRRPGRRRRLRNRRGPRDAARPAGPRGRTAPSGRGDRRHAPGRHPGLSFIVVSGLLLFAADIETFLYSRVFWIEDDADCAPLGQRGGARHRPSAGPAAAPPMRGGACARPRSSASSSGS